MGGIGKTTLATALYVKLSHEFEGGCFLTNGTDVVEGIILDLDTLTRDLGLSSDSLAKITNEFSVISEEMMVLDLEDTARCALPTSIWHNKELRFVSLRVVTILTLN
ncbi:uncharacterized protein LOC114373035 [Glycine soja]|uniref:uncharacterized protein n=1 Tax=Glycine max TaxID=3847 RepID=UPI000E21BD5A|nr:uncharacterized protein LOC112998350 [Glycine max]XP_028186390.1 uncharacterized protein LOC114373035 [Glycine soja]|eukprot:XP_025980088.1 uncharacterized protein LOC112998350 [Glycine max]